MLNVGKIKQIAVFIVRWLSHNRLFMNIKSLQTLELRQWWWLWVAYSPLWECSLGWHLTVVLISRRG